jgi:hypothetical protein
VDAKKKIRGSEAPKISTARKSELTQLSSPRAEAKKAKIEAAPKQEPKPAAREKKSSVKAAQSKAAQSKAAQTKAAPSKAAQTKTAKEKAAPAKGAPATAVTRPEPDDSFAHDIRSRHVGAARAAAERDAKITTKAIASDETVTKKHFAALHLFDAFQQNKLPKYGGFIVCVRFVDETGYTIFEIIGYENLQDIYPDGETLVFKSVGCKLFAIAEPPLYLLKSVEPPNRPADQMIPYRFSELARVTTKRFQSVLIGRKPVFMPTSFSVFKPAGDDLAILFYDQADVYANIQDFLIMILRDRLGLPAIDSRKSGEIIAKGIRDFRLWMDEA